MPTKTTYYAIVDAYSSRQAPGGVMRRVEDDDGEHDEEITEDEANRIVDRIRRSVTGQES